MVSKQTTLSAEDTDRRIDALLGLLAENPTIVISGAKIAKEIGVSRQQVWRWIEKLRALGVEVAGHLHTGYHIEGMPDVLAPQLLNRGLRGTPFTRRIVHFFRTDSTNNVAMRLGEKGEPHGTVVLAEEQTAGKGRAGRSWASEKSAGIYCSILLRPQISPGQASLLSLVAVLAARDAVMPDLAKAPDIRWPNDLVIQPVGAPVGDTGRGRVGETSGKGVRKLCGILTEMHAEPGRIHYAVVGIGINVNQTKMPAELKSIATSMRLETGSAHSRVEILIRLLRAFDGYYNQFCSDGAAAILRKFAEVSSYVEGKRVRIKTASGEFTGTTAGLEPSGVLRVARDDGKGIEAVISGDVAEA